MRERYSKKLEQLGVDLYIMCEKAIEQLTKALKSLKLKDYELAKEVIKNDNVINMLEKSIESDCLHILLREHPFASDFRKVSCVLKMIRDIERIGDHAEDICSVMVGLKEYNCDITLIEKMGEYAIVMLKLAINSYIYNDENKAKQVAQMDDSLDEMFDKAKKELSKDILINDSSLEEIISLLMISKYLERIGDHAVNVSEWINYQ